MQTEEIELVNKWTQKPPTFGSNQGEQDIKIIQSNLLGVGGDTKEVRFVLMGVKGVYSIAHVSGGR